MREARGDLFARAAREHAWLVITTNGALTSDGRLVMGAGVARVAARRFSGLDRRLGAAVAAHGNVPVADPTTRVLTWPTKPAVHELDGRSHPGWMCQARVHSYACERVVARLVWKSAPLVVHLADELDLGAPIYLPRPGCGLGGLEWSKVGPHLARVLDDRFVVLAR